MRTTILTAISLFVLFSISPSGSSLAFSLDFPSEVKAGENFDATIIPQEEVVGTYDVKIFVNKHTKEYSEVFYENSWKSPFNYLSSAFPAQSKFTLRANIAGSTNLCVRLRKSGEKSFSEVCNPISVGESESPPKDSKSPPFTNNSLDDSKGKSSSERTLDLPEPEEVSPPSRQKSTSQKTSQATNSSQVSPTPPKTSSAVVSNLSKTSGKVVLNAPSKVKSSEYFLTKKQRTRVYMLYALAAFAFITIILLALRKL